MILMMAGDTVDTDEENISDKLGDKIVDSYSDTMISDQRWGFKTRCQVWTQYIIVLFREISACTVFKCCCCHASNNSPTVVTYQCEILRGLDLNF